jgi:translation initiation factor IF-2
MRVMRGDKQIHEGEVSSLKIMKDDVREVRLGYECGISLRNFNEFNPGDIMECYIIEKAS